MAMGPLRVFDLAGLDVGYKAREALSEDQKGDPATYRVPDRLVEAGRLKKGAARQADRRIAAGQPPCRGGATMMCAPCVPGNISHGAPGPVGCSESPVDAPVAIGR